MTGWTSSRTHPKDLSGEPAFSQIEHNDTRTVRLRFGAGEGERARRRAGKAARRSGLRYVDGHKFFRLLLEDGARGLILVEGLVEQGQKSENESIRALANEANVDGSALSGGPDVPTNLSWRTISVSEGRNLAGASGQALNAPEVMYNANGTITGLQPSGQTRTGQSGQPITIINPIYGRTFQWNDCVVTITSQQYAAPFFSSAPFQSLTPTPYAKGSPYGNNHNSLSNSTISALVSTFVQSIPQ